MFRGLDSVNKAREVIQYKRSVYITHIRTHASCTDIGIVAHNTRTSSYTTITSNVKRHTHHPFPCMFKPVVHKLTPWSTFLLYEFTSPHLIEKFPAFYGNQRFIMFIKSCYLSSFRARRIHSTPSHYFPITLSSHLLLRTFQTFLFLQVSLAKSICRLCSYACYIPRPSY